MVKTTSSHNALQHKPIRTLYRLFTFFRSKTKAAMLVYFAKMASELQVKLIINDHVLYTILKRDKKIVKSI